MLGPIQSLASAAVLYIPFYIEFIIPYFSYLVNIILQKIYMFLYTYSVFERKFVFETQAHNKIAGIQPWQILKKSVYRITAGAKDRISLGVCRSKMHLEIRNINPHILGLGTFIYSRFFSSLA